MQSWFIIIGLVGLISGGGILYYTSTQNKIEELTSVVSTLRSNLEQANTINEQNIETIDALQTSYAEIQLQYTRAEEDINSARVENTRLRDILSEHNIEYLAVSRPSLVQRIINNGSADALRCMELLSGSPLTESERNAETNREFNSVCPDLRESLR